MLIWAPGSFFLHAPFVLFGGEYTIWLSRFFVWFEFAVIACLWTLLASKLFGVFRSRIQKAAVMTIAFVLTAHYFPIMAWHSIDALLFATIGAFLLSRQSDRSQMWGYVCIGAAPLFRQNFLFLIPVVLIFLGGWRRKEYWLASFLPALALGAYLILAGALPEAFVQLTANGGSGLLKYGIGKYLYNSGTAFGVIAGLLAMCLVNSKLSIQWFGNSLQRHAGILLLFAVPLSAVAALLISAWESGIQNTAAIFFSQHPSFVLFGAVLGIVVYVLLIEGNANRIVQYGLIMLVVAWCVSISRGYNTPALMAGPLVIFLLAAAFSKLPDTDATLKKAAVVLSILLLLVSLFAFHLVRTNTIYLDMPAGQLTKDVGDIMLGARWIKTNPKTYDFIADLATAKDVVQKQGKKYVVLYDFSAAWIRDPQSNPISSDWPIPLSLINARENRVEEELADQKNDIVIVVQKYDLYSAALGLNLLQENSTPLGAYVTAHFNKTGETKYFNLYAYQKV